MPLTTQIVIYAGTIAAALTFMRIISGITGSRKVRMSILGTAAISAFALFVCGVLKVLLSFNFFLDFITTHFAIAKAVSSVWFLIWMIAVVYLFGFGVLMRMYVRALKFKDKGNIENYKLTPIVDRFKRKAREKKGDHKDYETQPLEDEELNQRRSCVENIIGEVGERKAILVSGDDPWLIRKRVVSLCLSLVKETNEEINYVCSTVSPVSVWDMMCEVSEDEKDLAKLKQRLVFVDAYTEVFGFDDDILEERMRKVRNHEKVDIVGCDSAAGIHSATGKAFNILKDKASLEKRTRRPCTVIYDSISLLAIPETEVEVSEFVIHLTAAEDLYQMQTIFVEPCIDGRDSKVIDSIKVCCGKEIEVSHEDC